jgi:hypothetical protein
MRISDVSGVDDEIRALEGLNRLGAQQTMGIGDDADPEQPGVQGQNPRRKAGAAAASGIVTGSRAGGFSIIANCVMLPPRLRWPEFRALPVAGSA